MDKEVLECVLKNRWRENAIQKILSIESSPAVEKFRNFLSTVNRLKLKVILGNGRTATRYLISKDAQVNEAMGQQFINDLNPFKTEIVMYQTVLKEMEYLMDEIEDGDEILWCEMVHYVPFQNIMLVDLQTKGFSLVDIKQFFDLDHGLMALHALGKFHAMSKVLEERGLLSKESFKPWFAFSNVLMQEMGFTAFRPMVEGAKLHWGPHWKSLVDRINLTPEMLKNKMKRLGEVDFSFNVVGHGDCNKNIMFKYGLNKRPTAIKLIDYQLSYYGSPYCDLVYMMYLSVDPKLRRSKFNLFMKTYHQSLCETLDNYKYKGTKPFLEEILEGMEKFSFFGLWIFINFCPGISLGEELEKYMDFQKIMETGGREGCNLDLFKLESLVENICPDFEDFINTYF